MPAGVKTRVIHDMYNRLFKNKRLILSLPLLLASLFVGSLALPSAHAQFTGLVCITATTTATSCPASSPTLGPFTLGQTFTIGLFVQASDAMGGWDIYVASDPTFVSPTSAALGTLAENIQVATVTAPAIQGPTTTAVSCSSPVAVGTASSCTATVTDIATTGATNPTGQVTFSSDGPGGFTPANPCNLSSLGSNQATCTVSFTPTLVGSGSDNIDASYSGDSTHAASTAISFTLTVTKSTPSLTTVINSTSPPLGSTVSDQAILTGGFPSTGVTGTVTYTLFPNGGCTAGTCTVVFTGTAGAANNVPSSAAVIPAAPGSYSFNATYSGDVNNNAVTSACEPFTVIPAPSFTAGKLHWTHHLSLAKSSSTQSWTAIVTNPLSANIRVVVRIVGASTTNPSLTFDITCGVTCVNTASAGVNSTPGLTPVPVGFFSSSTSFSFNQPIPGSFANQKFTFTATLYWSTGTTYVASNSKSGAFAVVS